MVDRLGGHRSPLQKKRLFTLAVIRAVAQVWDVAQKKGSKMKVFCAFCFIYLSLIAGGFASAGVGVERNLVFSSPNGKNLKLNLYRPVNFSGKLPVVVLIYGGGWMMRNQGSEIPRAKWLATNGYAVAVIDYRLSSEALFPAQIYDCKAAVRWLRANAANYSLDPDHIAAWGDSAGAHLAAMIGTTCNVPTLEGNLGNANESSKVQAVVDFFGPTDFSQMKTESLPGSWIDHDASNSPESLLIGGAIQENRDKVEQANPIKYVTRHAPPFFIAHGDRDLLVPWQQSQLLFEALENAKAHPVFYKIAGAGHGDSAFDSPMMRAAVLAFLDKNLKE